MKTFSANFCWPVLPSGRVRLSDKKLKKSFFYIDAGHFEELSHVNHRGPGEGVGHDGTVNGHPAGLRSGGFQVISVGVDGDGWGAAGV